MSKAKITLTQLESLRARNFHIAPGLRIKDEQQALDFIEQAGFLFLWLSDPSLNLPSLSKAYVSAKGDWGWWEWKQTLPERKACFYAKVLRHKGTFISWSLFPCFYAIYAPHLSYEEEWQAGLLPRPHKRVLEILREQGPLQTKELRLAFGPPRKENTRIVKRALEELQAAFRVSPAGGDTEGWSHHRWELVERWAPGGALRKGRAMEVTKAGAAIVAQYLKNVGVSTLADICWLFSWSRGTAEEFIAALKGVSEVEIEDLEGSYITLKKVLRDLKGL